MAYLPFDYIASDRPLDLRSCRDLNEAIANPDRHRDLVAWVIDSGRLSDYALARNLGANRAAAGPGKGEQQQ